MKGIVKLKDIATQMHWESAEETPTIPKLRPADPTIAPCGISLHKSKKHESLGVYNATVGKGRPVKLLKTMLTTACERNCNYCPFRAGRNYRRTTFKPQEMADSFMQLHDAGYADGIFLSSGIIRGGVTTQDKLIDTVDILRNKYRFRGYIHLKIMPGAEQAQVARSMQLADRLSINLEAPTTKSLAVLAPMKELVDELFRPLKWVEQIRSAQRPTKTWNGRWPSTVTQFVVGAGGESDVDLLTTSAYLYRKTRLRRAYFSAFRPIHDTPLENVAPTPPIREHRLYQASFLLRDYSWGVEELPFDASGLLPHNVDPKIAWARQNLADNPVELNWASKEQLLRVPGIGLKSAETIIRARRTGKIRSLQHLRQLGVHTKRLESFILLDGTQPARQLRLF